MDAIDARLARYVRDRFGTFTTQHAATLGFSEHHRTERLASGEWERAHDEVYRLAGVARSWRGDLLAACWAGGHRAFASHGSAAALWELAGARRQVPEITCPRWRRARHEGIMTHELKAIEPGDVTILDGIPVASAELTLLGLAAVCSETVLELAFDRAEQRGLVTPDSVRGLLARLGRRGRPGVRALRSLVDLRAPEGGVAESEMETLLRRALVAGGLPEPVMQHEVMDRLGRFVARVDAAYPGARIAIEYDSNLHHSGRLAIARDGERRSRLLAAGWRPFTATLSEVRGGCRTLVPAIRALLTAHPDPGDVLAS